MKLCLLIGSIDEPRRPGPMEESLVPFGVARRPSARVIHWPVSDSAQSFVFFRLAKKIGLQSCNSPRSQGSVQVPIFGEVLTPGRAQ